MKQTGVIFITFLILAVLFIVGSFFELPTVYKVANFALVLTLLLYYVKKTKSIFGPMMVVIMCFYVRDILMANGFSNYPVAVMALFSVGIIIWYLCGIIGFPRANLHKVEIISLLIMYSFLGFLTHSMIETVPEAIPSYSTATYFYFILLTVLLGLTFTGYLIKSHWASLWLMVASASLLISEISLYFKMFILQDVSVNLFFPLFHIFMFYCLVQYALQRRWTGYLGCF